MTRPLHRAVRAPYDFDGHPIWRAQYRGVHGKWRYVRNELDELTWFPSQAIAETAARLYVRENAPCG